MTAHVDGTQLEQRSVELVIGGMTCASCAARIEKKLNRMPGCLGERQLRHREGQGHLRARRGPGGPRRHRRGDRLHRHPARAPAEDAPGRGRRAAPPRTSEAAAWRQRLVVSAVLTVPVLLMSMVPALQFDNWQWLSLTLASPVVVWGALPFHRAAWANLRHGAATMDTLISVGVGAAYLWSLWALLFTDAGMTGMRMPFDLLPEPVRATARRTSTSRSPPR